MISSPAKSSETGLARILQSLTGTLYYILAKKFLSNRFYDMLDICHLLSQNQITYDIYIFIQ